MFRVPKNIMFPRYEKVHVAIENYSSKEDQELDEKINQVKERLKNVSIIILTLYFMT